MTDSRAMVDAAVRESAIFPVATRRVARCSHEAKTAPLRRGRTYSLARRHDNTEGISCALAVGGRRRFLTMIVWMGCGLRAGSRVRSDGWIVSEDASGAR